jgi:hypothetical protein
MERYLVEAAYCAKAAARPPHSKWVRVGAIGVGNYEGFAFVGVPEIGNCGLAYAYGRVW